MSLETAKSSKSYKGEFLVVLSAIGFGTMGVLAKFAYQQGLNPQTLLILRFALSSIMLYLIVKKKRMSLAIPREHIKSYFILGTVLYTLVSFSYFYALNFISASLTVVLFFLYPIFVGVISAVFLKERISRKKLLCLVLSIAGIYIVASPGSSPINMTGLFLSLFGAFMYAVYVIYLGSSNIKRTDSLITGFYINLFSAFGMILWGIFTDTIIYQMSAAAFLYGTVLALFASAGAVMAFFAGVKLIGSVKASIIANVEPFAAVILATVFLSESLSIQQLLGGLLIITAVIIISLPPSIVIKK